MRLDELLRLLESLRLRKARALLYFLLADRAPVHRTEKVTDLFWQQSDDHKASASYRQAVKHIRRAMEENPELNALARQAKDGSQRFDKLGFRKAGNADEVTLPAPVKAFLRSPTNRRRLVGIIGSGNRNFGAYYQAAARELAAASGRPVLFEFELSGTPEDVTACARILDELDAALARRS